MGRCPIKIKLSRRKYWAKRTESIPDDAYFYRRLKWLNHWDDGKGYFACHVIDMLTNKKYILKEHRYALGLKLKRHLKRDEIAHHINGNRQDNRPENLELCVNLKQPPCQRVEDMIQFAIETIKRYGDEYGYRFHVDIVKDKDEELLAA